MKLIQVIPIFLLILVSCSQTDVFPEKIAQGIGEHNYRPEKSLNAGLNTLLTFVNKFQNRDESFNVEAFKKNWDIVQPNKTLNVKSENDRAIWASVTGLLLELTQDEKYAAELEQIGEATSGSSELLAPFILTKNVDHIYVNLFEPTEISYSHTLGGEVSFRLETDYPKSGSIRLHFGMTERRYMELYVRIPEWAEGSTVIVKQVKYFASPGSYCKIAKKWKEGDLVEIELPMEKYKKSNSN